MLWLATRAFITRLSRAVLSNPSHKTPIGLPSSGDFRLQRHSSVMWCHWPAFNFDNGFADNVVPGPGSWRDSAKVHNASRQQQENLLYNNTERIYRA